jgi:hypothetical protein
MKSGRMLGLILILGAPAALAEQAVSRDGSDKGSSSSAESSHPASSGGSSGGSSSSAGSSSSSGDSGSSYTPRDSGSSDSGRGSSYSGRPSSPPDRGRDDGGSRSGGNVSDAERRHPRPGTGRDGRDRGDSGGAYGGGYGSGGYGHSGYGSGYVYGGGYVLPGHYGPHYHGSIFYPNSCYRFGYYDDYYYDGPYRYRRYYVYDPTGAVRVLVDPPETKVFVDGYYAGTADDFDGIFQRLYLPPGRHELALKLSGYKSHRVMIYSARGQTIKLHHDMVRGEGDEAVEDLAGPVREGEEAIRRAPEDDDREEPTGPASSRNATGLGTLRLNVSPKDASVYVDGEFWGTGIHEDVKLPVGRHEISVVRPGFRSFERHVDIHAGDVTDLDVQMDRS